MKFLLFLCMGMAASLPYGGENSGVYLAKVRQHPSVLHKCNAFFVTKEHLVGTASCFLCNKQCKFEIVTGESTISDESNSVHEVSKVIMHPNYVLGSGKMYNIAVIKLAKPANDAVVLNLGNSTVYEWGELPVWSFTPDMKQSLLDYAPFKRLKKRICKVGRVRTMTDDICVGTVLETDLGPLNEGAPFVVGSTVYGIYRPMPNDFPGTPKMHYAFASIPAYYDWILQQVAKN